MSIDFSKYQTLINSFRGQVGKSNFDAKFAASTKKFNKTESFLLKMELKRLASPCTRSIDLRGLVDGNCKVYEYQGQSHFLDEVAIKTFEDNIELYGAYTFGVYEAAKNTENNFRVIYQNEKAGKIASSPEKVAKVQEKLQYPAKLYQFAHYHDRIEERMNFAISLDITRENKQQISAMSSNISVNGCKFRITQEFQLEVGEIINIKFTGMEQEFQFGSTDILTFQVKNCYQDGDIQMLGCQRVEAPEKDAFKRFLHAYIQGNKRRYKINLSNTIKTLQSRSFEQYILPKINELPIFIQQESTKFVPRYALTTNNNQAIFQYWQDEQGRSTLHSLLNEERIKRLQKQQKVLKPLLVYSFIHQHQGKSFFYTIDDQQLPKTDTFLNDFLAFAAKKSSFTVTKLTCLDVDQNNAYAPFSLSNTLSIKKQYINLPPSEEVKACLAPLAHIIVVKDIAHPSTVAQYQKLSSAKIDTKKLKLFGHKRLKSPLPIDELGITYKNQRQELRFMYKTDVVVECEKVKWQGQSEDFSVSGLKIQLDKAAMLSMGDIVFLTFPKLQKITSAFDLRQLPYEIVRINKKKTIINLRVHVKAHQHIGRAFFKLLINKNRDKLTTDEYNMLTPGLAGALRTLYAKSMRTPALMVQTSGSRYKIEALACNNINNELLQHMKQLSDRQRFYNLYPLVTKLQTNNALEQSLKQLLTNEEPVTQLAYIAIDPSQDKVNKAVNVALDSELDSVEMRQFFIRKALKRGQFYCLQLKLSRTNEPDMEYLNAELSYVSSYAIHRGKQIEQDIWSVVGVIQVFDVTKEILLTHGLAPKK
ncbi:MAG: PilZ domain-containing protein [Colwellia sp.]|nr:PilZ domain-containing protein [Colwellia sp.]MCW8863747.1 PilZ domain-containing protein [Colwellia sp.]MCW9081559.1 PilZ domain-containing protein [Colwellia sp.]